MKVAHTLALGVLLGVAAAVSGCAGSQPTPSAAVGTMGTASVGALGTASTGGSGLPAHSMSGGTGTGVGTQPASALATTAGSDNGTSGTFAAPPSVAPPR